MKKSLNVNDFADMKLDYWVSGFGTGGTLKGVSRVLKEKSPDFIPQLAEDVVAAKLIDGIVPIDGNDALNLSKRLAQEEGIFVGISSNSGVLR